MSDRTPSSVRSGPLVGDAAPPAEAVSSAQPSVEATQAIPTTGSVRAQAGPSAPSPASTPAPPPASTPAPPPAGAASPQASRPPVDARASEASRGSRRGGKGRGPRRARLQLRHIDTWSALKISFVLSIALFFIWMVAVGVLYAVLSALGVFGTINELFGQLGSSSGSSSASSDVITPGLVFGAAAVIGAINIVLLTALCTVGAFIYNLCSDLVGGLEVTLSERD
jgi:hypothetical protein